MDKATLQLMKTMSSILNLYQDIEDLLDDINLTEKQKLRKIRSKNNKIGGLVAKVLPG